MVHVTASVEIACGETQGELADAIEPHNVGIGFLFGSATTTCGHLGESRLIQLTKPIVDQISQQLTREPGASGRGWTAMNVTNWSRMIVGPSVGSAFASAGRQHASPGQQRFFDLAPNTDMFPGTHGRQAMLGYSAPKALRLGDVLAGGAF